MGHIVSFKRLNQRGFDHVLGIVAFIVIFGILGTAYFVFSHAASWSGELQLGLDKSLCLDNLSDKTSTGNTIDAYSCNGTQAQDWTITDEDGSSNKFIIKNAAGNLCADNTSTVYDGKTYYVGTDPSNRVYLKTATCSPSNTYQLWMWSGSGGYHELKNIGSGGCINDTGDSKTSGTAQIVYTCGNTSNEQWFEAAQKTSASSSSKSSSSSSTTSSSSSGSTTSGGIITAGDSKANCVTLAGGTQGEVSLTNLKAAENTTGLTYNCLETFNNPVDTWADWEAPWQFTNDPSTTDSTSTYETWASWLKAGHQVILGQDLIPQAAPGSSNGTTANPLEWEEACDAGDYDTYAAQLAKNLVSYGAGGIVIRLGIEANGSWEADYTGSTTTELSDWAKCYDKEVTSMRAVSGADFLFVWNPNICTQDFDLDDWYPGNSYVNIIGADAYDNDCHYSNLETVSEEGWEAYYTDSASDPGAGFPSLSNIEALAAANDKPMSFPEWGLTAGGPDDSTYMTDMGQMFKDDDFAFESYFDTDGDGIAPLGSTIPNATATYKDEF